MNASFKAAFIFLLATTVVAGPKEDLEKLKQRHPFLAPLSDLAVSTVAADAAIAGKINSILSLPDVHAKSDLWKEILLRRADYPFEENETGLTENLVEEKLTAEVEDFFVALTNTPAESMDKVFEERQNALVRMTERLITLELVQQLFTVIATKEEILFRGDVIVHTINLLLKKSADIEPSEHFDVDTRFGQLKERLESLKVDLEQNYFPQVRLLLDLLANSAFYLSKEVTALHLTAQLDSTDEDALSTLALKFAAAYDLFAQASVQIGQDDNVAALFEIFQKNYIAAVKAGSKVGTLIFKQLVPDIAGHAIRIIGERVSLEKAYQVAKNYLRFITNENIERDSVVEFLQQYLQAGNRPALILSDDTRFAVESLKTVDIVKRVAYQYVSEEWWSETLPMLNWVFKTVSADLINALETSKAVACNRISSFAKNPAYFLGLYNLVMNAIVEMGPEMAGQHEWVFALLDFVQMRYEEARSHTQTSEAKYLLRFYPMIVTHVLAFRNIDEGSFDFQAIDASLFKDTTVFQVLGSDEDFKGKLLNALAKNVKEDKALGIAGVKADFNFLLQFSGRSIPLKHFKKLSTENKATSENTEGTTFVNQRQGFRFRVKDSKIEEVVRPNKTPTPVVIDTPRIKEETPVEEKPKEEPVVHVSPIKEEPVVHVSPKKESPIKEPTPIRETTPIQESPITEPIRIDEPSPKKESPVHEPTPKKESPVKEPTPIRESPVKEKTPVKVEDEGVKPSPHKINLTPRLSVQDLDEEENGVLEGEHIPLTPTNFDATEFTPEERDNIIEVLKGSLDPEIKLKLEKTPDMYQLVTDIQIVKDPETGDETHYYYLQLVETGTACHDEITDALD